MDRTNGRSDIRERLSEIFRLIFELDTTGQFDGVSVGSVEKWDSLNHITLIAAIEEEFGVCFPPDEAMELTTFTSLAAALEMKLQCQSN